MLKSFIGFQQGNEIVLRWTISAGYQCQETIIERSSYNSLTYEEIGRISGICGSATSDETYTFTDRNPLSNTINQYQLKLGDYKSQTVLVEFLNFNKQDYIIFSNPLVTGTRISFENSNNQEFEFVIYDLSGKKVLEKKIQDNFILINRDELKAGIYIFTIISLNKKEIKGKLSVI